MIPFREVKEFRITGTNVQGRERPRVRLER